MAGARLKTDTRGTPDLDEVHRTSATGRRRRAPAAPAGHLHPGSVGTSPGLSGEEVPPFAPHLHNFKSAAREGAMCAVGCATREDCTAESCG